MTISREKCLEPAENAELAKAFGSMLTEMGTDENEYNRAYAEGQKDMQYRIIDKLGSYDANKCAQIAASLEIK